jgi:hypothetical protein
MVGVDGVHEEFAIALRGPRKLFCKRRSLHCGELFSIWFTIQAQAEKEQRKWEVDQEKYFFVLTGKDSTRKCCRRNSPCEKHKGTI